MLSIMAWTTVGFVLTVASIAILIPVAYRLKLVDVPGGRKAHQWPTPVIGGLGMACGAAATLLLFHRLTATNGGLVAAGALLLLIGLADDRFDLHWSWRLAVQTTAALLMCYVGGARVAQIGPVFGLGSLSLGVLSVPFTVLATVGLINALNMVDGSDGLAGSQVLCALAMLSAAALYVGNWDLPTRLGLIAGCVGGFLVFNLRTPWNNQARVFLGNSGSALLGLGVAWASFRLTQDSQWAVSPVLAPFLIAIPVMDCLALFAVRLIHKRHPFAADHSHVHHRLAEAGFSATGICLLLGAASLTIGLAAALGRTLHTPQFLYVPTYAAAIAAYAWLTADEARSARAFAGLRKVFRLKGLPSASIPPADDTDRPSTAAAQQPALVEEIETVST